MSRQIALNMVLAIAQQSQDHGIQAFQLKMIQNDSESTQLCWPDSKQRQMKCADYPGPTRPYPTQGGVHEHIAEARHLLGLNPDGNNLKCQN